MPGHVRPGHVCSSKVMFRTSVVRSSQVKSGEDQVRSGKVSLTSCQGKTCHIMSGQSHVTQIIAGKVRSRKVRSGQNVSDHMMVRSSQIMSESLSSGQSGQVM